MNRKDDPEQLHQPNAAGAKSTPRSEPMRVETHIKRHVFRGFIVLVPVLVTFLVLRFVVQYVDSFFRPLVSDTFPILDVPGIGVLISVVLLYLIGTLVSARAGRRAINWQDAVLTRVPIVKSIYSVAKQATDTIANPMGHQFSRVVFVEWPRSGYMALGFVTGLCRHPGSESDEPLLVVYIPTVPNPTSGNLAFVYESEVVESDMTMEDAMKIVFSGGIVMPDNLRVGRRETVYKPVVEGPLPVAKPAESHRPESV